jgi:hypothetical protein
MIKYWGDTEWNNELGERDILHEVALAQRMFLRDLNKPELLIQFMRANAKDPDTPIFNLFKRHH